MPLGSKIFVPCRGLGYVTNHIPLQVRYIKSRKEQLIVTCIGKSFHTYGISHFGLLSVSGLHPGDITCMTSDSFHVYTACNNIIYAWRRGTELKHTYKGHPRPVTLMLPFGPHLITVDEGGNVRVWDIKMETVFLELSFNNKNFQITTIVHPATYINKVLFGSHQGNLQLWNIRTAKCIYQFKGWGSEITCLEQSPAIDVIAVGLVTGKIILHNLRYDETVLEFTQDWGSISSISFRTDGHPIMATASNTGHIVFWNLEEKRVASQIMNAHDASITGMVCLPNEPLMLTSSPDNTLKLWIFDMIDGGGRLLRIREGHSAVPNCIRFHGANGHNILSSAGDSTLRIFNTQTEMFNKNLGKASFNRKISKKKGRGVEDSLIMPPIFEFTSEITREKEWDNIAALHVGLPTVTTWSYDKLKMGELKLLPERLQKNGKDFGNYVTATSIHLTHCGNFVLVGYSTGHVDRYNMQSGIWRDSYGDPKAHDGTVNGITVDPLNQITVTGSTDCTIKFWLFKSKGANQTLRVINLGESVKFFRYHSESSMLAVALEDFTIIIVDVDTKSIIRKFFGHTAQITDATFAPDSRWLITSSMDCSIRTWDVPSAQLVDQFKTEFACTSLSMSPTGEALATAHVDYLGIFLWSNRTLYNNITLKALSPDDEPTLIVLPEVIREENEVDDLEETVVPEFLSPEQISEELITLSGLPTSRWQNLLNLDIIKMRNKPKEPPKAPKAVPFFLPTVPSLNFQFDTSKANKETSTRLLEVHQPLDLSELSKLLQETVETNNFEQIVHYLKSLGPSMIDFQIKSLLPESGGSVIVMLQFLNCIEFMLNSNKNFELAQAYLGVFLKSHGKVIASEEQLRNKLPDIQSCASAAWDRIQEKLLYCSCVVSNIKSM